METKKTNFLLAAGISNGIIGLAVMLLEAAGVRIALYQLMIAPDQYWSYLTEAAQKWITPWIWTTFAWAGVLYVICYCVTAHRAMTKLEYVGAKRRKTPTRIVIYMVILAVIQVILLFVFQYQFKTFADENLLWAWNRLQTMHIAALVVDEILLGVLGGVVLRPNKVVKG